MEAFVITLREGMEGALVAALVITYLNRTGRDALRRWAYAGLALAIAASVLGAVLFSQTGIDPENPLVEGTLLAVAAVLVFSLVAWMWRSSASVKRRLEDRLDALSAPAATGRQGWGVLALVFFMVFREGIEIVLFLAALSLTAAGDLTRLLGAIGGLALAAVFGFLFVKGSIRINLRRFFAVTGLVLLLFVVRLAAGSVHEFMEVGLLPQIGAVESIVDFIIQDSASTLVLVALVALPVLSLVPDFRVRPESLAARAGETAEQQQQRIASLQRARVWQVALVGMTLATVLVLTLVRTTGG